MYGNTYTSFLLDRVVRMRQEIGQTYSKGSQVRVKSRTVHLTPQHEAACSTCKLHQDLLKMYFAAQIDFHFKAGGSQQSAVLTAGLLLMCEFCLVIPRLQNILT